MLTVFAICAQIFISKAYADCDELERILLDTPTNERVQRFLDESLCTLQSTKFAETVLFPYVEVHDKGFSVLLRALEWGMSEEAEVWILGLLPNERMHIMTLLGKQCSENNFVHDFLFSLYSKNTQIFWADRWDIAIRPCLTSNFREQMKLQIEKGFAHGENRFWGALTTYIYLDPLSARMLLKDFIRSATSIHEKEKYLEMYEVFAEIFRRDKSNETLKQQVEDDIISFVDILPSEYVTKLRAVLLKLEAENKANSLARYQYLYQFSLNQSLLWGGIVLETVLCTNNLYQQRVHTVLISDPMGSLWGDQVEAVLLEHSADWTFSLSKKCKGTEERTYLIPEKPFQNNEEWIAWVERQTTGERKNPKMISNFQLVEEQEFRLSRTKEPLNTEAPE